MISFRVMQCQGSSFWNLAILLSGLLRQKESISLPGKLWSRKSKVNLFSMDSDAAKQAVQTSLSGVLVAIKAAEYSRCDRCWHQVESVGQNSHHPELCGRCVDNIEGDGELRQFA